MHARLGPFWLQALLLPFIACLEAALPSPLAYLVVTKQYRRRTSFEVD